MKTATSLRVESRARFPNWSRRMRAKWVLAKMRARRCTPHWARMVPMTADQIPRAETQFCLRTLPR